MDIECCFFWLKHLSNPDVANVVAQQSMPAVKTANKAQASILSGHHVGERNFLRRSCLLGVKANVDILRVLGRKGRTH